jgi:hypothetical protein
MMRPTFDPDRVLPLALSLRNSPGCYVALVGAGLSVGSEIPAAWQVVEKLINQIARAHGESPEDPDEWYRAKYGRDPTYQDLLADLAPASGDRHGLLRPLFARTPSDEAPTRQPNGAHIALARLAALGLVKVFITTNFDLLIEDAIREDGLNPITIAAQDDWHAAPPLDTMQAAVIHIHGEWQRPDTLRNTADELRDYPEWVRSLLTRSLDGRGYLIIGWSGRYDPALREALRTNRTGRYSTYWVDLAQPVQAGRELLVDLSGIVIEGDAADVLGSVVTTVDALAHESAVAGSGAALSVARAKRDLSSGIRPLDALDRLGAQVDLIGSNPAVATTVYDGGDTNEVARQRRVDMLNACREAAAVTMALAALGRDDDEARWLAHIAYLGQPIVGHGGSTVLLTQHQMPGVVLLAAAGVGACAEGRWALVNTLLTALDVRSLTSYDEAPLATSVDLGTALAGRTTFDATGGVLDCAFTLLYTYLANVNGEAKVLPSSMFDESWERWEYLWTVAIFAAGHGSPSVPHLLISGRTDDYRPVAKPWFDRLRLSHPDELPWLVDAAPQERFEEWLTSIADRSAWSTLPPGGGALPSGHWRLDDTGTTQVRSEERTSWAAFLR